MKYTKHALALLLALVMALSLALPAMAETEEEAESPMITEEEQQEYTAETPTEIEAQSVNWDEVYIITQPPWEMYVPRGKSFALNAEVNVPEGLEVTYQWHGRYNSPIKGATARTLQLGPRDAGYPSYTIRPSYAPGVTLNNYYCVITVTNSDDGQAITLRTSEATVYVGGNFLHKLYSVTLEPFVFALEVSWETLIFAPVFIFFPFIVIWRYITNFRALSLF